MPYSDPEEQKRCNREASRRYRETAKGKKYRLAWRKKNWTRELANAAKWRKAHPDSWRAAHKKLMADPMRLEKKRRNARLNQTKRRNSAPRRIYDIKLRSTYGIGLSEYEKMVREQRGRCAICKKKETMMGRGGKIRRLSIDHCHEKRIVRGLLCGSCNIGIGNLKHDASLLRAALQYLKSPPYRLRAK